jgi:hypothetical protein
MTQSRTVSAEPIIAASLLDVRPEVSVSVRTEASMLCSRSNNRHLDSANGIRRRPKAQRDPLPKTSYQTSNSKIRMTSGGISDGSSVRHASEYQLRRQEWENYRPQLLPAQSSLCPRFKISRRELPTIQIFGIQLRFFERGLNFSKAAQFRHLFAAIRTR